MSYQNIKTGLGFGGEAKNANWVCIVKEKDWGVFAIKKVQPISLIIGLKRSTEVDVDISHRALGKRPQTSL